MMRAATQPPSVESVGQVAPDVQAVCVVRFRRCPSRGVSMPCSRGSWRTR
jgi:hypothetical protein